MEPTEVAHIQSETGDYALVSKIPAKKKRNKKTDVDVSSLLSSTVRAQLPLDATEQIGSWEEEKKNKPSGGYVQLHFHTENSVQKGKIMPENPPAKTPVDSKKTKFGYSTVVFEAAEKKESDLEYAEQLRQNKPPPIPPPKYEASSSPLPKHSSDSRLLRTNVDYSDIDFSKKSVNTHTAKGTSSPDLRQSSVANGDGDESPYVNVVRHEGPPVPPRRGVAAIVDESPPVPIRKIS